jgi:hypothetical protein
MHGHFSEHPGRDLVLMLRMFYIFQSAAGKEPLSASKGKQMEE